MPGSFPIFDDVVAHLIARLAPQRALDIGPGSGKYGQLLAEHAPQCRRCAVEVEASYAQRYGLAALYHELHLADVTRWWRETPTQAHDLVLIGDCIEHLPKSAGLDLLNALVYRCAWLVVLAPEFVLQGPVDGVASEAHLSVWSERDLHWHDLWAWDNARSITLMVLRGYLPSALTLSQWVDDLHAAHVPVHHFDGHTVVRPARLRLVQQPREVEYRRL